MTRTMTGPNLNHAIGVDGLVSIRLRDGDVRIEAVDGDTVRIRDRSGHDIDATFDIELAEGSASLSAVRDTDRSSHHRAGHAPDLHLDVPRRATILVETANADIEAVGLLGDQRYRTTSGDVTLRTVAGRVDIEAVSGDLDIVATGEATATLRTVSGDVELRAATLRSLVVATTSGDLNVAGRLAGPGPFGIETVSGDGLFAPAGDLRIEMTTMSGDLQSDIDARSEGRLGRRSLSIGSGGPLLTFRSMSGDLRVVRSTPVPAPAPAPRVTPATDATEGTLASPERVAEPDATSGTNGAIALAYDDARLRVLRSLERGEIDVAEAGRRLEALDDADPKAAGGAVGADDDVPTDG